MKVVAIIQARMGSSRFPNKVMRKINDVPMIGLLLARLSLSKEINQIIIATTTNSKDDELVEYLKSQGYKCERGSENDVLERFYFAAKNNQAEIVVRITGDCPLIDSQIVDSCIQELKAQGKDYFSNIMPASYPDGLDVEVCTFEALEMAQFEVTSDYDREHVMPYLRDSKRFNIGSIKAPKNFSHYRWTVDELNDFNVISKVFNHFHPKLNFSWQEVLKMNQEQPDTFAENSNIIRNEGAKLGSGQKLWKRAKTVIPGGNMLLSKRAEMFLPEQWPAYFSKTDGCRVWDLDGNEYIDMSIMGIGTNTLGYNHPEVDAAVRKVIDAGNMSTLNCPEEVYLAEKLVELHPWADMVRFARSGGEANAIAIRIARAASGKDKVAVCGYHGWHDWYLSANLGDDESLAGHLLPGLNPKGVPSNLRGTVFPFNYNNYKELESLVNSEDIGVIKMEVVRNKGPEDNFLQKVRKLATDRKIILIFDECTSGFRETFGGIHKKYGVEPDMAMFGKALGNGYAISATIGRREIMEAAQSTFISSTFWTERIGPAAALATLKVMESEKSWEQITKVGTNVTDRWQKLAIKHGLDITTFGLPALTGFSFNYKDALAYKTFLTQEMLKQGYLAATNLYVSTAHTTTIVDDYFDSLDAVFASIKECVDGRDVFSILNGPICHSGFKRLN